MDQTTHFLFLAALILVIICCMFWLSGASCIWGFIDSNKDTPGEIYKTVVADVEEAASKVEEAASKVEEGYNNMCSKFNKNCVANGSGIAIDIPPDNCPPETSDLYKFLNLVCLPNNSPENN